MVKFKVRLNMIKKVFLILILFFSYHSNSSDILGQCQATIASVSHTSRMYKIELANKLPPVLGGLFLIRLSMRSQYIYEQTQIIESARKIGGVTEIKVIRNILKKDPSNEILRMIIDSLRRRGDIIEGISIIRELLDTKTLPNTLIKDIAYFAGRVNASEGILILKRILKINYQKLDSNVLQNIIDSAGALGGLEGIRIIKKVLKGYYLSESTVWSVAHSVGLMNKSEGVDILTYWLSQSVLSADKTDTMQAIAYSAGLIGGSEGIAILKQILQLNPDMQRVVDHYLIKISSFS